MTLSDLHQGVREQWYDTEPECDVAGFDATVPRWTRALQYGLQEAESTLIAGTNTATRTRLDEHTRQLHELFLLGIPLGRSRPALSFVRYYAPAVPEDLLLEGCEKSSKPSSTLTVATAPLLAHTIAQEGWREVVQGAAPLEASEEQQKAVACRHSVCLEYWAFPSIRTRLNPRRRALRATVLLLRRGNSSLTVLDAQIVPGRAPAAHRRNRTAFLSEEQAEASWQEHAKQLPIKSIARTQAREEARQLFAP